LDAGAANLTSPVDDAPPVIIDGASVTEYEVVCGVPANAALAKNNATVVADAACIRFTMLFPSSKVAEAVLNARPLRL
jgi:hypothetical protein